MEGVTDPTYREVVEYLYPEWDYLCTDFLRVPSAGKYPQKYLIKHFGQSSYIGPLKQKTIYQILTSENAFTQELVQDLSFLNFSWIDLNLGCPSKTVVKHRGGSYLLSLPDSLKKIVSTIRANFQGIFTVKIRLGFEDDRLFESNLKILEDCGVDAITIHGRTREQLYKGVASWDHIQKAVKLVNIPIIANGDIWSAQDINRCFDYTGCHSVMIARGAMKSPWLARDFYHGPTDSMVELKKFLAYLESYLTNQGIPTYQILKRFKGLIRYSFNDFTNPMELKVKFLRAQSLEKFNLELQRI
jgi:tRNA-dihydrouridine synthase